MGELTKEIKIRVSEKDFKLFEEAKGKGTWKELFFKVLKQKKK